MNRQFAVLTLAVLAGSAAAQNPPEKIEVVPVAAGVYVLYASGGNIGVSVGPDGVILIDDQYAPGTPQVLEALATLSPHVPRFVINTHWHTDHTGGNENLAAKGSVIVAHDKVRERMSVEQFSEFFQRRTPASPAGALPVVTFNDSLSLHVNGEELRGYHAAQAHTDGDTVVMFRKSNVIHTGDLFFHGMYPFIDLESGGSVPGLIAAVDRMIEIADANTRVIPGHGKLTDRAGLVSYRAMLAETSGRIERLVKEGKSVEEVLAAKPNADYDATLAWAFITAERYTRILYADARRRASP